MRSGGAFIIGIFVGVVLMGVLTYIFPENIRAVNENNVKNGRGYYHPQTGDYTWKECK